MTTASAAVSHEIAAPRTVSPRLRALDAMLAEPAKELELRYRDARVPRLGEVSGDLRGRMLAWPALDARPSLGGALRAFAGSRAFPWLGKSFRPFDDDRGEGINRVISNRFRLFRFDTSIGPSRAGDFDALQLDYDLDGNPGIIRRIKDEMREVDTGLWLGQAYLKTRARDVLVLYFGLAKVG